MEQPIQTIEVHAGGGVFSFDGWHLGHTYKGVEHPNWHYYLAHDKSIYHFRKDKMIAVWSKKSHIRDLAFDTEKRVLINTITRDRESINV